MLSRHRTQVNGVSVFAISQCAVALVISEAVLHANDDPGDDCQLTVGWAERLGGEVQDDRWVTHQRLVKTTPKPKATKNNSGELVGPGLLLLFAALVDAEGAAEVEVGLDMVVD